MISEVTAGCLSENQERFFLELTVTNNFLGVEREEAEDEAKNVFWR